MDPTICYREMLAALNDNDLETARECALALQDWLNRGGFYPTDCLKEEVLACIADVLRPAADPGN